MRVLQAKLLAVKRQEERAEMDALKGDSGSSWGNQMRSYVLSTAAVAIASEPVSTATAAASAVWARSATNA